MRIFYLWVGIIILGACSYIKTTTASPVDTAEKQTPNTSTPIQFIPVTPILTPTQQAASPTPTGQDRSVEDGQPLAARVNNRPIYLAEYERQLNQYRQTLEAQSADDATALPAWEQIKQQALTGLIDQEIIKQQAQELAITVTEAEVESAANQAIEGLESGAQFEDWLAENDLTREQFLSRLQTELVANRLFEQVTQNVAPTAPQVRLRVIVLKEEVTAQNIITQLKTGQSFAALAQQHSLDKASSIGGGDLGWFPKNSQLAPANVEEAAFALTPGEISGPINTPEGLYIIKLEQKETNRPLAPEMLYRLKKQRFANWLLEQRAAAAIEKYVEP